MIQKNKKILKKLKKNQNRKTNKNFKKIMKKLQKQKKMTMKWKKEKILIIIATLIKNKKNHFMKLTSLILQKHLNMNK
jgi:hypothetical protein